jgi:hypothetical protein
MHKSITRKLLLTRISMAFIYINMKIRIEIMVGDDIGNVSITYDLEARGITMKSKETLSF